jgi:NAD(P)-dependent dehydrogenase (short-subunit alcohol dehydrogenase family)
MSERYSTGETAVVVGIGGEVGHGVAAALLAAGYRLAASADQPAVLDAARTEFGPVYGESFEPLLGEADNPALADWTIGEFRPRLLVLIAGADERTAAQETFLWCREVITGLLANSTTIVVSGHPGVRVLVEDTASQPEPAACFGIRFLFQDTAGTAEEIVAAVLAKAGL